MSTRSEIITDINTNLPTNGNNQISANDLRGVLIQSIVNEFMNLEEDAEIPNYSLVKTYKAGKLVLNQGVIWRANIDVAVSLPPPTLPTLSNTEWTLTGSVPTAYAIQAEAETVVEVLEANRNNTKSITARSWRWAWDIVRNFIWDWVEKITFQKGVNLGTNPSPATNGDLWYNSGFFGRISGQNYPILTSLNSNLGRVLFVSKNGNDTTAQIGNPNFPYLTIQGAINASTSLDLIVVYKGLYVENLSYIGTGKKLKFIWYDVTLQGNIFADGIEIDGTYTSSIVQTSDTPILFANNNVGDRLILRNFVSIERTIALNGIYTYDIFNNTLQDAIFENIERLGNSNPSYILRLNGTGSKSFKLINIDDIWLYQYLSVMNTEFERDRIRRSPLSGEDKMFFFKNCKIWTVSGGYFSWCRNVVFENCDIYIDTPASYQFIAQQSDANSVVRMDNCNIQSTNPAFSYLFEVIGGVSVGTFIMTNCKGNIPLVNIKNFIATNEFVDYEYLPFLTTVNEVTN